MSRDKEKGRTKIPKHHVPWAEATAILGGASSGAVFVILGIAALDTPLTTYGAGLICSGALCALLPTSAVIWRRLTD